VNNPFDRPRYFVKRPIEIQAALYDGTNEHALVDWITRCGGSAIAAHAGDPGKGWHIDIHTLEGVMCADMGDWIIRGVAGEFYPCKPDIFEATYEAVEEPAG
jgi:hypothetical protein